MTTKQAAMVREENILKQFSKGESINSSDLMYLISKKGGSSSGNYLLVMETYLKDSNVPLIIANNINGEPIKMAVSHNKNERNCAYAYMMTPEQALGFLRAYPEAAGRKETLALLESIYNNVDEDLVSLTNVALGFTNGDLDECQQGLLSMLEKYVGNTETTLQITNALISIERRKNIFVFTEKDIVSKIKKDLLTKDYDGDVVNTLSTDSFRFCLGNTKHGVYVIDEDGSWTFELTNDTLLNDVLIENADGFLFSEKFIDVLDLDGIYNSLQTYNNLTQKPRFWF